MLSPNESGNLPGVIFYGEKQLGVLFQGAFLPENHPLFLLTPTPVSLCWFWCSTCTERERRESSLIYYTHLLLWNVKEEAPLCPSLWHLLPQCCRCRMAAQFSLCSNSIFPISCPFGCQSLPPLATSSSAFVWAFTASESCRLNVFGGGCAASPRETFVCLFKPQQAF